MFFTLEILIFLVVLDLRHVSNEGAAGAYAPLPDLDTCLDLIYEK